MAPRAISRANVSKDGGFQVSELPASFTALLSTLPLGAGDQIARATEDLDFECLLTELRQLPAEDYEAKAALADIRACPRHSQEHRCMECVHYNMPQGRCGLPELALPVEAHWSCRFWQI